MVMLTYSRAISDNAARHPGSTAITCGDESVTWAELEARTNRRARAFADLGVAKDSLVTIGLPNSIAFLESMIATWKLGATPQPVSHRLPDRERQAIVDLADSVLVVGARSFRAPDADHVADRLGTGPVDRRRAAARRDERPLEGADVRRIDRAPGS